MDGIGIQSSGDHGHRAGTAKVDSWEDLESLGESWFLICSRGGVKAYALMFDVNCRQAEA